MKMKIEVRFEITNWLAVLIYKWRMRRISRWHRGKMSLLESYRRSDLMTDADAGFKWDHLIWQEVIMWAKLGSRITMMELYKMCIRRGFSTTASQVLIECLGYAWLLKKVGPRNPGTPSLLSHVYGTCQDPEIVALREHMWGKPTSLI